MAFAIIAPFSLLTPLAGAVPVAAPARAPFAAAPASKLRTIDNAAFAIFKHAFLPIRTARVNPQRLRAAVIGIHAKGAVAHPKLAVCSSQFLQSIGHVNVVALGSILSAQN